MQVETLYAAGGALAGALAALVIYHYAVARPALARLRALLEVHDGLIGGDGAASDRFALLEEGRRSTQTALQKAGDRIAELENRAATDLSRAGFVRYDAFTDGESGLSYALALLNRQGDGVVITSIYSRSDTRTFGKPVAGFKPTVQASAEELEAIERARLPAP
jgi:hypothetical protein